MGKKQTRRPRLQLDAPELLERQAEHVQEAAAAGEEPPAPLGAPEPAADADDGNPLASLLDYSDDEEEEQVEQEQEQAAAEPPHEDQHLPEQQQQQQQQPDALTGAEPPAGGRLQAQLHSFLSELESSGLLHTIEQPAPAQAHGPAQGPAGQQAELQPAATAAEPAAAELAAAEPAAAEPAAAEPAAAAGARAEAGAGAGAGAEQRVLGVVDGAPDWLRVLDTGSGKEYYWSRATNEVAWQPPVAASQQEGQKQQEAEQPRSSSEGPAEPAAAAGAPSAVPATSTGEAGGAPAGAAPADDAAAADLLLAPPSGAAVAAAEAAAQRCEAATGALLDACPRVVQLAIEARCLAALLALLAERQAAATDQRDCGAALSWRSLEATVQGALGALVQQLPAAAGPDGALGEQRAPAQKLQEPRGEAAAEAQGVAMEQQGALPPLPREGTPPLLQESGSAPSPPPGVAAVGDASQPVPQPAAEPAPGEATGAAEAAAVEEGELPAAPAAVQIAAAQAAAGVAGSSPQHAPGAAASEVAGTASWESTYGAYDHQLYGPAVYGHTEYAAPPVAALPGSCWQPPLPAGADGAPPLPGDGEEGAALPPSKRKAPGAGAGAAGKRAKAASGKQAAAARPSSKQAASLINKWQAVAREVREEEEAEAAAAAEQEDPVARAAALERQRRREAEEWRLSQLRSGAADANPNFAPLPVDWRLKVKRDGSGGALAAVAEAEDARAAAAATGGAGDGDGPPDLDAITAALPAGWRAMWDATHTRLYYGNLETKETRWLPPT